jgi:hypothetical protein
VSRVMRVWIGCGSVHVRVRFLRVYGSCLFLRILVINKHPLPPLGVGSDPITCTALRWYCAGTALVLRWSLRAIGVAKMKPMVCPWRLVNSFFQTEHFASAGAPCCFNTFTFPQAYCKYDPGHKQRFRVGRVHISHFHVSFLFSF